MPLQENSVFILTFVDVVLGKFSFETINNEMYSHSNYDCNDLYNRSSSNCKNLFQNIINYIYIALKIHVICVVVEPLQDTEFILYMRPTKKRRRNNGWSDTYDKFELGYNC